MYDDSFDIFAIHDGMDFDDVPQTKRTKFRNGQTNKKNKVNRSRVIREKKSFRYSEDEN